MSKDHDHGDEGEEEAAAHRIRRIRVFKWNIDIPINGNIMFLFLNNSTSSRPAEEPIPPKLIPVKLPCISSSSSNNNNNKVPIKELKEHAHSAISNAYQSLPETMKPLGVEIAKYLEDNFRLSFETLFCSRRPKTIIVVEYGRRKRTSLEEEGDGIAEIDYIVRSLKHELGVSREVSCLKAVAVDEPLELVQVPPLTIFQKCEGRTAFGDEDACVICQEKFTQQSDRRKAFCSHVFHRACIARWLWTRRSCPLCRSQLA